ncbi:MAG TPA: M2 family metallopeptidase, partial [Prosthecobacter sp.]|nr:M2 family metallopeptidase [Prosthecobacter sp.]
MKRLLLLLAISLALPAIAEDWPQFMFNAAHSGNAAEIDLDVEKLGLQGAVAMTDGIYYNQPAPKLLPAHWIGNRWGQDWPGLAEAADPDDLSRSQTPDWIVTPSEKCYTAPGIPPLPKSFWEKSALYQLPPGSKRKKNTHASAWHIDMDKDVRSLMSVIPNFSWFKTSHHELGHVYYYIAYSNPKVPIVLREGANRAFHEAIGDLIAIAAGQQAYLKG